MVSECDGGLYDTRLPDWSKQPIRPKYKYAHREINSVEELKATLRTKYAWPGGYEIIYLTSDGALLCHDCVIKNLRSVFDSTKQKYGDGWKVISVTLDNELEGEDYCSNCNKTFNDLS